MKRTKTLKRKTKLRRMHPETEKNLRAYIVFKQYYLHKHPYCDRVGCLNPSEEIHHMAGHGYRGNRLCDERWLMAICRDCHRFIHEHGKLAREQFTIFDTV